MVSPILGDPHIGNSSNLKHYRRASPWDPMLSSLEDRIWGIWGSYYDIRKAIFYLFKGEYTMVIIGL